MRLAETAAKSVPDEEGPREREELLRLIVDIWQGRQDTVLEGDLVPCGQAVARTSGERGSTVYVTARLEKRVGIHRIDAMPTLDMHSAS